MTNKREAASASLEATALRHLNSQLAQANEELAQGHRQFHAVLNNITQGVCLFDGEGRLLVCNRRYAEIYNLSAAMTRPGLSLAEIVDYRFSVGSAPAMTRGEFLEMRGHVIAANEAADTIVYLRNGRIVAIHHEPMEAGGWVATHEDITEREHAEASIRFMARHDALTSLPNRVLFLERLEQAVVMAMRNTPFALFALDLDHFKSVNDTFGHPVGDGLLKAAADRLQACVRDGDTVARLGGDEFAIIQLSVERSDEAVLLGDRLMEAFRHPFEISGHHIAAGFSVGITLAPGDGVSSDLLLKNADIALYLSKSEGRGRIRFFEPEMDARIQIRRRLEEDLRAAIAGAQFELFYHPLVNLSTGKIVSFEALLRWRHPTRGLVSPVEFISVAEETGMIVAIGEWALNAACVEAAHWPSDVRVAVNLSAVQFARGDVIHTVRRALSASGLQGNRLELEITETALLRRSPGTLATLHELHAMGVTIALDDFGTGYSSLSYLRSFPFHKIKIDQSFIRDILKHDESLAIVRAISGLGQSLRMTIAAEGVETRDELVLLRAAGCSEIQGYIFGEPAPAAKVTSMFNNVRELNGIVVEV